MNNNAWTRFFDIVFKYVLINFLAFFSSILGLFLFGIFPALSALLFTIKFVKQQTWRELIMTYWLAYKSNFIKANVYGWSLSLLSIYLFFNTRICFQLSPLIFILFGTLSAMALVLTLAFGLNCFLFLDELIHRKDLKSLFFYTIYALPTSLLQIGSIGLFLILISFFPAFILFGGLAALSKINLYLAMKKTTKLMTGEIIK
ncbi:DUF624 domain-containing protein [Enterococcus alcedinis]|uniref:DUF624 domain-containing protein n=1 Tax=Enterococcus alcedinis TaxID=1274384 RepID=A0A917N624_9ENTE|nr:DUF624 domain-containing protein [Enterococcus alcedinis]MBP2101783.1 putative membrane protein YesL [Enterococcus alcedinis]GGI65347.1 hypothetical protein GCM10011482_10010 [Enterococcus alcedinis]